MAHAILMPKPGQMTEECTLILWRKQEGEVVHKGDVLFEIETDKSAMEVEAFDEGVLLKQVVAEGESVPVNAVCAWVGEAGEVVPDVATVSPTGAGATAADAAAVATAPESETPAAAAKASAPSVAPAPTSAVARTASADARLRISPRASRLAASAGVDPRDIVGSGPVGRITERDVQAAVLVLTAAAPAAETTALEPAAQTAAPQPAGPDEVVEPMSRMRRVIAQRLTQSWTTTPHFTVTVAADLHRLFALRTELKQRGVDLGITDLVLTAVAQTLVEFPDLNTRIEGTDLIRRERVHLGLAVSVPGGLLVPVIRDAHLLSVIGIRQRSRALIAGARAGTLDPDDLAGSTFTVSNLGMLEVDEFSAIINPGEGAILAVASAVPTPVAIGDGIAVHPIMKLTLSADHRVVDGETAARFLGALRRRLEDTGAFRNQVLMT